MRFNLLVFLFAFAMLFGCFGFGAPQAPPYQPPAYAPQAPSPSVQTLNNSPAPIPAPAAPAQEPPPELIVTSPNDTAQINNTTEVAPIIPTEPGIGDLNSSEPAQNTSDNSTAPAGPICGGFGTSDQLDCIATAAISQKNVGLCTQLVTYDDRIKCFNRWCNSGARDYHKCSALADKNDRMSCLNMCNPNFNH